MQPFDVVIVPDFTGRASTTFEARTLYFLASWIEFAGSSRQFPLPIASIGEPPASVRTLANRAGARISIHEPMGNRLGAFANKLRGFDVPLETDRIFLLDVDVVVLSDLTPLAELVPPDAIGAARSHSAIILPEMWEALYERLGMTPPARSMMDFHLTLDDAPPPLESALYPSFNSGALIVPRDSELRYLWLDHLETLMEFRDAWTERLTPLNMLVGDEPALATAMHVLQGQGQKVCLLPDRFHGRWRHLYRRNPTLREFAVFHVTSSFSDGTSLEEKLDPKKLFYIRKLLRRYGKRWLQHSRSRTRDAVQYLMPATLELLELQSTFHKLYEGHIRELVR